MQGRRIPFKVILPFVLLLASVAIGAFAIHAGSTKQIPGNSAAGPVHSPVRDIQPGPAPEQDGSSLDQWETFWTNRLTYPTGRFDPAWLRKAEAQDSLIQRAVPAGTVVYNRTQSHSPLTLDPNSFTSLGPQPVTAFGRNWSGRVNSIVVDPVTTNVAYMAVNGAGIWKTTNCCTSSTTWLPVTDLPQIPIIGVDDVIIDPHDHNTIYAGTGDLNFTIPEYPSAGILKSTDQGATWTVLGEDVFAPPYPEPPDTYPQDQAIGKVRVDPRNSQNIVAGTATGVFFSYDGGTNWSGPCFTNSYSTQRQDTTGLLLRDNGIGTDIYVATGTRAFSVTVHPVMAENGADGIYSATLPTSGCPANWNLVSRPNNGWPAGTGGGIPHHLGGNPVGRIDMNFAPSTIAPGSTNVTIYAQAQSAATLGQLGLWRTTDGGATWTEQSNASALGGCGFDFGQNWFDQFVTVDATISNTLYMGTFEVWKSTDGGVTFNDLTCSYSGGIVHPDQHALTIAPGSSRTILDGNDGGIYLSTDAGTSWVDLNSSMSTLEIYGGDITGNFANSAQPGASAGTQDNGSMANVWSGQPGPADWTGTVGGDGFWSRIEPMQQQNWYAEANGYGQRHIFESTSGPYGFYQDISGAWLGIRASIILPYELYKYDCPSTGCTHLIMGTDAVSETLTGAGDWITVSPVFPGYIDQLSYAVSLSTTAILGLSGGQVEYGFGLGHGTMATWVNVTGGNAVLPNRPILDVTTDPINPLVGYAAAGGFDENTPTTPGHVFQVTCSANCAGFTWLNKSGNLPDIPIDSIIANPLYPQQVFAGSDWGLYYTNDITVASPVWNRFDAGLPHVMIYDMTIDQGFTTLAAWTRSRGGFVWPLPAGPIPPQGTPLPTFTAQPPTSTGTSTATSTSTPQATATQAASATASATANTATATSVAATASATATLPVAATATPTACQVTFTDVPVGSTFYPYIHCLACLNIINGYPDGTFRPNNNVTRGQIAKIVSNSAGYTETYTTATFVDVPVGSTFFEYVERLASRGIVAGYPCGGPGEPCPGTYFRPNNNVTRGQTAKIVAIAKGLPAPPPGQQTFEDVPPSGTFWTWIEALASTGAISGYPCSGGSEPCIPPNNRPYFRPGSNVTRGQASKIVSNTFFPDCQASPQH